jgi:hypothetical protein
VLVSAFAIVGDLLEPKSFAGLFGAALSVALATLSLTVATEDARYVAIEARSMDAGGNRILCLCKFRKLGHAPLHR